MSTTTKSSGSSPFASPPPEAWAPLVRIAKIAGRPLDRFLQIEAASGILLLVAAAAALIWANSPWAASYTALWHTPLGIRAGGLSFERTLEWLVNDGLMVIFFFVVGMEIRREIHHGELSDWHRAALPAAAALGGMAVPAILYIAVAGAPASRSGWAIPTATDIAFAVGILTLLGKCVPSALRVLLLALAVIDDLGAIVVIALFYSSGVSLHGLGVAVLGMAGIFAMQRLGVRTKVAYVVPSMVAWAGIYASGVHPTIAGVIVGVMTPVRAWLGPQGFLTGVRKQLDHLSKRLPELPPPHEIAETLRKVGAARREATSPAESLIETLHPWVAFGIMPIFALANAGVRISDEPLDPSAWNVVSGVVLGLVVGKPIGIFFGAWLTLRLGVGRLPVGVTYKHLVVLGIVAGVGFTMSLFIAQLAFASPELLAAAKLGVLVASAAAAALGIALGRALLGSRPAPAAIEESG